MKEVTKEEAVSFLRRYRQSLCVHRRCLSCSKNHFQICVYRDFLVSELIRRIRADESVIDPVKIVDWYYSWFDYILGESDDDHFVTHDFAARMALETERIRKALRECDANLNKKQGD